MFPACSHLHHMLAITYSHHHHPTTADWQSSCYGELHSLQAVQQGDNVLNMLTKVDHMLTNRLTRVDHMLNNGS